jgi:fatty-acyl-CoA synthase
MRTFDPGRALRVIGDPAQGITHFFAVPAPYQFMMQHPDFETTDLSRLRSAGVGGAPCALTILQTWAARGVLLMQGFGMTETSPACIFLDPADAIRKLGSTGKVLMHTEMRIVNDDGGDCGPNEIGELWVAGPNITPGYWNRPDATASSFCGALAQDRRCGPGRRRRVRLHRRPLEGHVHLGRRERLSGRSRERAVPVAPGRGGGGDRRAE